MEKNVENTMVVRISRPPSPAEIIIYQKQQEDVEYFSYFGSMINYKKATREPLTR